jgi:hypothetical protein
VQPSNTPAANGYSCKQTIDSNCVQCYYVSISLSLFLCRYFSRHLLSLSLCNPHTHSSSNTRISLLGRGPLVRRDSIRGSVEGGRSDSSVGGGEQNGVPAATFYYLPGGEVAATERPLGRVGEWAYRIP